MCTGSSSAEVMRRQKRRPSLEETRQPLVTFQRSFISSLLDGVRGVSWRWVGKRPGERPIGIGDCTDCWRFDCGKDSVRPGE